VAAKSDSGSPPRLVVCVCDRRPTRAVIAADELELNIQDSPAVAGIPQGVCMMIYNLLASYYVWDLSYPKQYQILAFFQLYLLKDMKESLFKCASFIKFEKLFRTKQ